jgi:hypothetical protein
MIVLARSELNDQVPEEASRHISEAVERLTPMVDPSGTSPSRPDDILASAWAMSAAISHELGHREAASLAQSSVDCLLALRASDENNQLLALHLARSLYVLAVCTYETDHAAGATQAARAGELTSGLGHEPCHLPGFLREAYQRWERVATCA